MKYTLKALQYEAFCLPGHKFGIGGRNHSSDWFIGDKRIVHERAYFPWNVFQPTRIEYWSEAVYGDKTLAQRDAKRFAGHVVECFYADPETAWFLIFDDLDRAFEHALEFLNKTDEPVKKSTRVY